MIHVPRPFIDGQSPGLDHAYALTSYAVQGSTHPVSTSRIDPTATRAEAYVDITRGRRANHLYLANPPSHIEGELLPRLTSPHGPCRVALRWQEPTAYESIAADLVGSDRDAPEASGPYVDLD
jgi:hypothetical protein